MSFPWISQENFWTLFERGWVVDGRGGGLVIGRSHAGGNIYMINGPIDGRLYIQSALEGGEYIVNHGAYEAAQIRLQEINAFRDQAVHASHLLLSPATRVLNTHSEPQDKLLWIGARQMTIINKYATAKFLPEIEQINHQWNSFRQCDLNSLGVR